MGINGACHYVGLSLSSYYRSQRAAPECTQVIQNETRRDSGHTELRFIHGYTAPPDLGQTPG